MGAEFLSQYSVKGIEGFLLQTAVHQNMDNLSLLFVLQANPLDRANERGFETFTISLGLLEMIQNLND